MVRRWGLIVEKVGRTSICRPYRVEEAIVVKIADGHSPSYPTLLEHITGAGGDIDKGAVSHVLGKQHRLFMVDFRIIQFNCIQVVALRHEQVFVSVVVIVEKIDAPA